MSELTNSIVIIPGGKNINNINNINDNENKDNNININNEEIKLKYKDCNIYIIHSPDFNENIEKGFLISIDHNFDMYKQYISHTDIKNSNNNIKFIKTIELNPDLIIKNINNKNFYVNIKSDYIEFIIKIIEFNNNITLTVKKDISIDDKDTKIKRLESKILELENIISYKKINTYISFNFYEIFEKFYPFTANEDYNIFMKDFIYKDKSQVLFKKIKFIEESNYIPNNNELYNLNFIKPKTNCNKFIINNSKKFEFVNCSKNDQNAFSNFAKFLSDTLAGFNININFLLSKNILLKKVIFNQNKNYSNLFTIKNHTVNLNNIGPINKLLLHKLGNETSLYNIFDFNFNNEFPYNHKFEFEFLNKDHNIKQVMFEIIKPNDINTNNKNYIFRCNLFDIVEYGIYIIEE